MANDAIASIQRLFLASIIILLVWLLIWPSAVEKFEYYKNARDLYAWLYLQERFNNFGWDFFLEDEDINKDITEDRYEGTEPGIISKPLKIQVVWPVASTYSLTLRPKFNLPETDQGMDKAGSWIRAYSIDVNNEELPFSDYEVIFIVGLGETWIIPSNDFDLYEKLKQNEGSLRHLSIDAKNHSLPRSWRKLTPHLARHGFSRHVLNLNMNEPALEKLVTEADPRALTIQVFGLVIHIGLFVAAVGLFLGAVAFALIGPTRALQRAGSKGVSHPWIMVTPTKGGTLGGFLEFFISAISIGWVVAPLILLGLQLSTEIEFQPFERFALKVGTLGLIFSSLMHLIASLQFRACRRS